MPPYPERDLRGVPLPGPSRGHPRVVAEAPRENIKVAPGLRERGLRRPELLYLGCHAPVSLPFCLPQVTPSLSLQAWRPGLFPPAWEPGGANGPFPRRPSPHGLSFPEHPAWGAASFRNHSPGWPRGVSFLSPDTQSWYLSCLPGCSTTGAGCPWGSAFPRRQKVPGSLFEPPTPLLQFPRPEWELCWEEPQAPLLWVPQEAMEPAGPWAVLRGCCLSWPTPEVRPVPHPVLQFPPHSFPDTTQHLQGQ